MVGETSHFMINPVVSEIACYQQLISGIILPRQMYGWDGNTAKAAPIGATSVFALAVGAVCCLAFHVFLLHSRTGFVGQWAAAFIVAAYLLFAPAVAGSLYSVLFESSKAFGLAGLAVAGLTLLTGRESLILLDGLLLLPFWFLGIMGVVKFVRWRASKIPANAPDLNR